MSSTTSSQAVASLDTALAAALERIDSALTFAGSLRTLDARLEAMDDTLDPLAAAAEQKGQVLAARATVHQINVPLHDAAIAAAALAANVAPMRDAIVQMRVWIESANCERGCLASAVDDLTQAVTALNEDLGSLVQVDAAVCSACDCVQTAQESAAPLLKGSSPAAPQAIDFFWSFGAGAHAPVVKAAQGLGDITHSFDPAAAGQPKPAEPQALKAEAPLNLDLQLPEIPRLHELPQELQRLVARFGDVRQSMGCVIGMIRALESV